TTTNGTRASQSCAPAKIVLAASFLNLASTADFLRGQENILLVCAGTGSGVALEDVLAAGALVESIAAQCKAIISDPAEIARRPYAQSQSDLPATIGSSTNGRRLRAIPELAEDVAFCSQRD